MTKRVSALLFQLAKDTICLAMALTKYTSPYMVLKRCNSVIVRAGSFFQCKKHSSSSKHYFAEIGTVLSL